MTRLRGVSFEQLVARYGEDNAVVARAKKEVDHAVEIVEIWL